MIIYKSIDVEEEIRQALSDRFSAYVRPLPAQYALPHVLITQVGGRDVNNRIDTFEVVLDARGTREAEALETLNTAVAYLRAKAAAQTTAVRHVVVNSSGSWGNDPVRPDLAMASARLSVTAHKTKEEIV